LVWLPSGQAIIRAWFAINYLGAIFVPINLDYKGGILRHAIMESNARLMIMHPQLLPRLDYLEPTQLERLLCVGEPESDTDHPVELVVTTLEGDGEEVGEPQPLDVWDLQMIIFTSGTTGPSKGVMCPYLHQLTVGQLNYGYMKDDDCMLVDLPLFHVGGISPIMAAIASRASVALYDGFRTTEFWQRVRACGATTTSGLIGAMASFLSKAPPEPGEENNSLRMVTGMLNQQAIDVAQRYRFSFLSGFNMTELSSPLVTEIDCQVPGTLGKPRTGVECRVVDQHDYEVGVDEVGELIVRADRPWQFCLGYLNHPEATAAAWRNGWFHTGDLVRCDKDGNFFFVDRLKDAVRRSGENVSSLEVEAEVLRFPQVTEAAVVGVPSEHGDQELLVAVAPKPGQSIRPRELVEFLIPRMAHYMVPRYIRVMDALPKTATNKIRKVDIRNEGVTADCWDREAENMKLKKTRLT
jgi:crotonobetaine/carnitine-CoA ligase